MALLDPTFENISSLVKESFKKKNDLMAGNFLFSRCQLYVVSRLTPYGWYGETIHSLYLKEIDKLLRDGTIKVEDNKILFCNPDLTVNPNKTFEEINLGSDIRAIASFHENCLVKDIKYLVQKLHR